MPERRVNGRAVAWREAGTGQPALLIHCALAHSGAWSGVMARLAHRLDMRAMDLPGHGGTGHDPASAFRRRRLRTRSPCSRTDRPPT